VRLIYAITSTTNMLIWVTVMETIIKDNLHKDEKEEALKDSVWWGKGCPTLETLQQGAIHWCLPIQESS
jgi:hypothetical protein